MAAVAGALIAGGASLLGGMMGSSASSKAAKLQQQAAREATAEERRQFDITQKNLAPFLKTGTAANDKLAYLLGLNTLEKPIAPLAKDYTTTEPGYWTNEVVRQFGTGSDKMVTPAKFVPGKSMFNQGGYDSAMAEYNRKLAEYDKMSADIASGQGDAGYLLRKFTPGDLTQEPGYQFQLEQGQQAIDRAAAARGNRYAGSTLKELLRYNTGLADSTYDKAFNRDAAEKSRIFGMLTGVSNGGGSVASTLGSLGQTTANSIGNNLMSGANAGAAGIVGSANALSSGISDALSFWNQYQWSKPKTQTPSTNNPYSGPWIS